MKSMRALAFYAVLTVFLTWPMITRLHIMDAGDSAFFAWEMAWEIHALKTDAVQLPHGNIFHPLRYTLAMDEPILGTLVLVLPLALFTDDAVWLFNVARLLTFVLSAFSAYLLARELGCGGGSALVAGIGFGFSLIRGDPIAHLSVLGTQWMPPAVLFTVRYTRTGRQRDTLWAALFYVLTAFACGYHGLIGAVVLPLAALPLLWRRPALIPKAMPAVLAATAALLPLYLLHRAGLQPLGYIRGAEETVVYSASLESFLAARSWNWLYGDVTAPFRTGTNELFVGLLRPIVILSAAGVLWRERRRPSPVALCFVVMGTAAVLVALGPEIRLFGNTLGPGPFGWLRDAVPVFQMIRVPARAGAFLALAVSMLFAKALQRWESRRRWIVGIGVLAVLESLVIPIPLPRWAQVIDSRQPPPAVYRWLAAQPGDFAIVELPILDIRGVFQEPAYHESIYMVRSTHHWKRLLNGYAGLEPPDYVKMREAARRFPSDESLAIFSERGARYVLLHRGGYGPHKWARILDELPRFVDRLTRVAELDGDIVFELTGAPAPAARR